MSRFLKVAAPFLFAALFVVAALPAHAAARTLEYGMSGSDVTVLQNVLVSKGYLTATPNGMFGPATLAAVKKFQCAQGIVCSGTSYGIAGPKTQMTLGLSGTVADSNTSVSTPAAGTVVRS